MGEDLRILYWQNPDTIMGNTSTVVVADVTMGRCHTCALLLPATCSDGILNQGEQQVDCGGDNCAACEDNYFDALDSCDPNCFDHPPRSDPQLCEFNDFATNVEGCAATAVGLCDKTCLNCIPCPKVSFVRSCSSHGGRIAASSIIRPCMHFSQVKRPASGSVECFGSNYLVQLGQSSLPASALILIFKLW